ncbi:hypothetical protein FACS1894217_14510 [Clostridia bacterium]|nr:hypothetical protein FACS1894217_14510 [Clostridia bacterium]
MKKKLALILAIMMIASVATLATAFSATEVNPDIVDLGVAYNTGNGTTQQGWGESSAVEWEQSQADAKYSNPSTLTIEQIKNAKYFVAEFSALPAGGLQFILSGNGGLNYDYKQQDIANFWDGISDEDIQERLLDGVTFDSTALKLVVDLSKMNSWTEFVADDTVTQAKLLLGYYNGVLPLAHAYLAQTADAPYEVGDDDGTDPTPAPSTSPSTSPSPSASPSSTPDVKAPADYIKGATSTSFEKGGKDVTFTVDIDLALFKELKLDGKVVDAKNYTVKAGSTVITLKADYIKTLKSKEQKFIAVFTDPTDATKTVEVPLSVFIAKNAGTADNSIAFIALAILLMAGAGVVAAKKTAKN